MPAVRAVWFNDGEVEDLYAFVVGEKSRFFLDLFVPATGEIYEDVPRREKKDYGPEGGGLTWHEDR